MRNDEATRLFEDADQLYREKRYDAALTILNCLDEAFPHEKNVMRPRARCLFKLNRLAEARALCEELVQRFNDKHAQKLLARLDAKQQAHAAAQTILHVDDLLGYKMTPPPSIAPPPPPRGLPWAGWLAVGALVVIVGVAASLLLLRDTTEDEMQHATVPTEPAEDTTVTAEPSQTAEPEAEQAAVLPPEELLRLAEERRKVITVPLNGQQLALADGSQVYVHPATGEQLPIIAGRVHAKDPTTGELIPLNQGPYFYTTEEVEAIAIATRDAQTDHPEQYAAEYEGDEFSDPNDIEYEEIDMESYEDYEEPPLMKKVAAWLALFAVSYTFSAFCPLFLTMLVLGRLPYDTIGSNLIHIAGLALMAIAMTASCVGWFFWLGMLNRTYDFGFVQFVVYFAITLLFSTITFGLTIAMGLGFLVSGFL